MHLELPQLARASLPPDTSVSKKYLEDLIRAEAIYYSNAITRSRLDCFSDKRIHSFAHKCQKVKKNAKFLLVFINIKTT